MSLIQDFFGLHSSNNLPLKTVSPLSQKVVNSYFFKKTENLFQIKDRIKEYINKVKQVSSKELNVSIEHEISFLDLEHPA